MISTVFFCTRTQILGQKSRENIWIAIVFFKEPIGTCHLHLQRHPPQDILLYRGELARCADLLAFQLGKEILGVRGWGKDGADELSLGPFFDIFCKKK